MRPFHAHLPLTVAVLFALLSSIFAVSGSDTLAQEATVPPCDTGAALTPSAVDFPSTLVVEEVLADAPVLTVDGDDADADLDETGVRSRVSISCIEASAPALELYQKNAATIIVVEGSLDFRRTQPCVMSSLGDDPCLLDSPSVARLYRADALTTERDLTVDDGWVTLEPGDILVVSNIQFEIKATDGPVRILSGGIALDPLIGGACPCRETPP